jgi:hypothetical protein
MHLGSSGQTDPAADLAPVPGLLPLDKLIPSAERLLRLFDRRGDVLRRDVEDQRVFGPIQVTGDRQPTKVNAHFTCCRYNQGESLTET